MPRYIRGISKPRKKPKKVVTEASEKKTTRTHTVNLNITHPGPEALIRRRVSDVAITAAMSRFQRRMTSSPARAQTPGEDTSWEEASSDHVYTREEAREISDRLLAALGQDSDEPVPDWTNETEVENVEEDYKTEPQPKALIIVDPKPWLVLIGMVLLVCVALWELIMN